MIAKHKETEMMHSWTSNGVIAQKILNKLRSVLIILELHPWLAGSVLVVIFVALFGFLQRHPTILDSDSLYHAKIVEFLSQGILVKNFPWLPLTLLANYYTDHHFLYHLILVPFVLFFDHASFPSDRRFLVDLFRRYILAAPISSQFSKSPAAFSDYLFFGVGVLKRESLSLVSRSVFYLRMDIWRLAVIIG